MTIQLDGKRIAFLSNHFSGLVKLEYLLKNKFPIDTVITGSSEQATAAGLVGWEDFSKICSANGIQSHTVQKLSLQTEEDLAFFQKEKFDLLLISGWQRLIPSEILSTLKNGAIGEHGSSYFLPKGRGRAPVGWSIAEGGERFVLHLFQATPEADDGAVIDFHAFEITPHDDIKSIYYKIGIASAMLTIKNAENIFNDRPVVKVEASDEPTYFRKRSEKDDYINWEASTTSIYNHIRATSPPYPSAKALLNGAVIKINKAVPFDKFLHFFSARVGEILFIFPDKSLLVKTVDGTLLIKEYECSAAIHSGMIFQSETKE